MADNEVHVNSVQPSTTRNIFLNSLTTIQGRTRATLNGMLQKTKRLLNRPEPQQHSTDDSVEGVSTTSTVIEDAMMFCPVDEAACSQYANGMSASEYHKMLSQKLGASLSTDGQTGTIRSTRQV